MNYDNRRYVLFGGHRAFRGEPCGARHRKSGLRPEAPEGEKEAVRPVWGMTGGFRLDISGNCTENEKSCRQVVKPLKHARGGEREAFRACGND